MVHHLHGFKDAECFARLDLLADLGKRRSIGTGGLPEGCDYGAGDGFRIGSLGGYLAAGVARTSRNMAIGATRVGATRVGMKTQK
ncbi:hypothetical protein MASR2M78_10060 [Treponema sp.]